MKQLKHVLRNLHRTSQFFNEMDRTRFIRMDGNESVDGLPQDFVKGVLNKITPAMLAAYPNPKKCTEAVAEFLNVDREQVLMTNGSDAAIKLFFETYMEENDRVVIASPAFEMYEVYCNMFGAEAVNIQYGEGFAFPMGAYIAAIEQGAKLAIITNPNNPTGSAMSLSSIEKILEIATKNDVLVMIDEAYHWIYPETALPLLDRYPNMILLRTFSKILGLAGIRLGFAVASKEMISDIKKVTPPAGVNAVALLFGEEIMRRPEFLDGIVSSFKREKRYMKERLNEEGIQFIDTESNFILIPVQKDVETIISRLREQGILVAFKMNKYLRVNIGNEEVTEKLISCVKPLI